MARPLRTLTCSFRSIRFAFEERNNTATGRAKDACSVTYRSVFARYCTVPVHAAQKQEDVNVTYVNGLPTLNLMLPSRDERCLFTLKPLTHSVGDFLSMVNEEDKGIERIAVYRNDGTRIAKATTIELLLREDFHIVINDRKFCVTSLKLGDSALTQENLERISDVRTMIARLHSAMNVSEHQLWKEKELVESAERLATALEPYEKVKQELCLKADRRTQRLTWLGLGLMGFQFGFLARLTWWEYSWDIMEPVTYFVTYGTTVAMFAYYVLTKQDYQFVDARDRQFLITFHREAARAKLDVHKYNNLKQQLASIQHDLQRLRDPVHVDLPRPAAAHDPNSDGLMAVKG